MNETIDYYNKYAEEYFNKTVNVSMQAVYDQFEVYLKPGDKILDLGCGSGRDSLYFLSKGYEVISVDGSKEMCRLAEDYIGRDVRNITFDKLDYDNEFDAVWACASLVHVDIGEITDVLFRIQRALKKKGVLYASWKYGTGERIANQKYYADYDEECIKRMFSSSSLNVHRLWLSGDNLARDSRWLNVICVNK